MSDDKQHRTTDAPGSPHPERRSGAASGPARPALGVGVGPGQASQLRPAGAGVFTPPPSTFYEDVGGEPTFRALTDAFYDGVAADPQLRALYPEEDLGPAKDRLRGFLEQYWGGPTTYSQQRGHPRLRMRHAPFTVTPAMRERWLMHMRAAVDTLHLAPLHEQMLCDYLERAAHAMVNAPEDPQDPASGVTRPS
ncbi:globin [Tersicoccus sp. MR15.9]|uniref:globin n=1 Tax=Tersicoccus mangrovi TaxID=3121635 RepID=UPI002FE50B5E